MSPSTGTASPGPSPARGRGSRLWQIDALRGLMLVLMTLTHVPTRFTAPAGQPFGYVSAAEGFVLLSAFMAGMVYSKKLATSGEGRMRRAFLARVLKIYLAQAALLFFLFFAVAGVGVLTGQPAITNLVSFYIAQPLVAFAGSLLLVYNPPLLDILPMYIVFMLVSPLVLIAGTRRRGWTAMLAASTALWLGSQFGLGDAVHAAFAAATGFVVPLGETGAFDVLAWQLLWMLGLWIGARYADDGRAPAFPRWTIAAAAAFAAVAFVWRHAVGQAPFGDDFALSLLWDKWQLGPLRLLDLFALLVLAVHFRAALGRLPRLRILETLGTASLPVFCAHLVIALLALAVLGEPTPERPWATDLLLLALAYTILWSVAEASAAMDRYAARVQARFEARRAARKAAREAFSATGRRWPAARWRSRPR